MKKWKIGTIVGGIWALSSLITLSGGAWLNPLIRYTFGLPTTFAFGTVDWLNAITRGFTITIGVSHIILFLLTLLIGALIGSGIGYLIDKIKVRAK